MSALLEVRDLRVTYPSPTGDRQAVAGISFDVNPGETVAIVGESGSGKTATALSLMGLLAPGARVGPGSSAMFEGRDLLAMTERERRGVRGRRVSMVFQEPASALNPSMRVGDQVAEVAVIHGQGSWRDARARAVAMLERTGIPDPARNARKYPHELSGGQRQRVMIAMALLLGPALVVADEPTSALDVTVQAQILALLVDLQREFGMAILLITHDLGVVAAACSRALVMKGGAIVESATVEALFRTPSHPYTVELIRAVPRLVLVP